MRTASTELWALGRPLEGERVANGQRFGHASLTPRNAGNAARRPRFSREARLRAEQLAIADRLRDEQLAVISQELRSSLGAVRSAARLLDALRAETPAMENARLLVEGQVGELTQLIDDLLELSRAAR